MPVQRKTTATTFISVAETQRSLMMATTDRSRCTAYSSGGGGLDGEDDYRTTSSGDAGTEDTDGSAVMVVLPEWGLGSACPHTAVRGGDDAPFRPAETQALTFNKVSVTPKA